MFLRTRAHAGRACHGPWPTVTFGIGLLAAATALAAPDPGATSAAALKRITSTLAALAPGSARRDNGETRASAAQMAKVATEPPGSRRTLRGVIETYWIDYPDHARRVDRLVAPEGTVELRYTRPQRRALAGTTVSVTGRLDGEFLALDPSDVVATSTPLGGTTTDVLPNVLRAQKLLVIPVTFRTDPSEPWTQTEISQRILGEADAYFRDVSLNRTWFEGHITTWVTVDRDPAICDPYGVAADAESQAAKLGFDAAGYDHVIYLVPALNCAWAGIGGSGRVWLRQIAFRTVVHELGHSFGLLHAHSTVCPTGGSESWPVGCARYEYGDLFDIMGASSGAAFNAFHQRRLGYLDTGLNRFTTLVDASGEYQIGAYAVSDSLSRALRIPAGTDVSSGATRVLYVTRREPVGRDTVLKYDLAADQNRILNGVAIHIALEGTGDGALIDTTPGTRDGISDMQDAPLLVGEVYVEPLSGTIVAPVAVEPGISTVAVTLGSTVTPIPGSTNNSPPIAVDDAAEQPAGTAVEIPVLANDSDPDADPLVISYLGVPKYGNVSLNSDGVAVYRAPRKFQGTDSFSYEISDGAARASALVKITVTTATSGRGGKGR